MKKINTPELDKMLKIQKENSVIVDFLEWLSGKEIVLAEWSGSDCDECGEEILMHMVRTKEQLLAEYYCIDLIKAEKERQAILDNVRKQNEMD